jgi:RNA polymerase sigma factor (TIGR02999 family)
MSEVTQILNAIQSGERHATADLLPIIYDHLRKLAAQKLSHEAQGISLQATALVHEAYVRLVDADEEQRWDSRGHFFAAAAEAMRRILIEHARKKARIKHGGAFQRVELTDIIAASNEQPERLLELDRALTKLAQEDATSAEIVKLHIFAGQSLDDVARLLGMSRATAYRHWNYARSWLKCELDGNDQPSD